MNLSRGNWSYAFACSLAFVLCVPMLAQRLPNDNSSGPVEAPQTLTQSEPSNNEVPSSRDDLADSKWHLYSMVYLWLPGMHGTLGVGGFDTSVHISAIDLLSDFRFGLMGTVTPTRKRFSMPIDYFFVRLKDNKSIPFNPAYTVGVKITESIITPKVAYLVSDNRRLKIYGTAGTRIWYEGTTLSVTPPILSYNPYKNVSWVDVVAGARFNLPVGPKVSFDVLGDAGGGGASLDYQIAAIANYQLKPKMTLQAGWRTLTVHYGNNGAIFTGTMQGMALGATYKFK